MMSDPLTVAFASKCILLVATAISVYLALSPPNPAVATKDTAGSRTLFERFIQSITYCTKMMVAVGALCDVAAGLSLLEPTLHPFQPVFCPAPPLASSTLLSPAPVMIFGSLMACGAAALRVWCFRTMGRHFTFEVTINSTHELITTGPYSYVRHPSYTGIFLMLTGATLVLCSPGAWLMECGVLSRGGILALAFWAIKCAYAAKGTIARLRIEDEALRKTFGATWDEWAKRVPYKLIPGVL
ncbi:hypothetical protein HGRIS_014622 [Hohenbuehelia grisea]|uniref:Protein-S-isoprenylcysteine O-methyltransferase n=1 Tax=Hohenbuehelia grisea TaxID=104357 RepID=A0ABR3JW67_9AGAR